MNQKQQIKDTYILEKQLFMQGFAQTWLARIKKTNEKVVLKFVKITYRAKKWLFAAKQQLYDKLKQKERTYLIKIFQAFQFGDCQYFVVAMSYCPKGDLSSIINNSKIDFIVRVRYMEMIARGVEEMQQLSIIHRNIKPQNILLIENCIKFSDFGLAKLVKNNNSKLTAGCGMPKYCSKESYQDDNYGSEVDIWAMGLVCLQLALGKNINDLFGELQYPWQNVETIERRIDQLRKKGKVESEVATILSNILLKNYKLLKIGDIVRQFQAITGGKKQKYIKQQQQQQQQQKQLNEQKQLKEQKQQKKQKQWKKQKQQKQLKEQKQQKQLKEYKQQKQWKQQKEYSKQLKQGKSKHQKQQCKVSSQQWFELPLVKISKQLRQDNLYAQSSKQTGYLATSSLINLNLFYYIEFGLIQIKNQQFYLMLSQQNLKLLNLHKIWNPYSLFQQLNHKSKQYVRLQSNSLLSFKRGDQKQKQTHSNYNSVRGVSDYEEDHFDKYFKKDFEDFGKKKTKLQYIESKKREMQILKRTNKKGSNLGKVCLQISQNYYQIDEVQQAVKYDVQALKIFRQLQDIQQVQTILHNLGNMCLRINSYHSCITYLQQYLQLKSKKVYVDKFELAGIKNNLGSAKIKLGHFQQAIALYKQSSEIYGENKQMVEYKVSSLSNLGNAYLNFGQYTNALATLIKADQQLTQNNLMGKNDNTIKTRFSLIQAYFRNKKEREGLKCISDTLRIVQEKKQNISFQIKNNLNQLVIQKVVECLSKSSNRELLTEIKNIIQKYLKDQKNLLEMVNKKLLGK